MKLNKEIEEILQDKFEAFSPDVPESVWSGIQEKLNPPPTPSVAISLVGKTAAIVIGVAAIIIGAFVIGNMQTPPVKEFKIEKETSAEKEETEKENQKLPIQKGTTVVSVETTNSWKEIDSPKKVRIKTITKSTNGRQESKDESVADRHITQPSRRIITLNDLDNMMKSGINTGGTQREESMTVIVENPEANGSPFATINASMIGGNAPLEIEFTQHSSYGTAKWVFGDGESSTKDSPSHVFSEPGTYVVSLIVEDRYGAIAMDEKTIEVTAIGPSESSVGTKASQITTKPNVFTPNGDGINDFMQVGAENMIAFHFLLLDLNTNKILFESHNPAFKWGGEIKGGETIKKGTYVYILRAKGADGRLFDESGPLSVQ